MPVNSQHTSYIKNKFRVKRILDFVEGGEKAEEYVLSLPGHQTNSPDSNSFRARAYFLPALGRTIDAFVGMIMANGAQVSDVPESFKSYTVDITNDGETISRFASRLSREVCTTGKAAVIVDYPDAEGIEDMTRQQAEDLGYRPYARFYGREDIINWQIISVGGTRMLSQLRLSETYEEPDPNDEWTPKVGKQIRVLDLVNLTPTYRVYRVRIYRQITGGATWMQMGADRFPKMNGKNIEYIPGIIFNPNGLDPDDAQPPPLNEMADICRAHLQNSAGHEWALMWCGCPTMVIAGSVPVDENGEPLPIKIGSSAGIVLNEGSTATLLQAGKEAVGALAEAMDKKENHMAAIGARILTSTGSSNISTETAKLERAGEHSVLADISNSCADGLSEILSILMQWAGLDESAASKSRVTLNTEFVPKGMASDELNAWFGGYLKGAVPLKLFFAKLKARGEVPDTMTEEDFRDELAKDRDELGMAFDEEGGEVPPTDDQEEEEEEPEQQAA